MLPYLSSRYTQVCELPYSASVRTSPNQFLLQPKQQLRRRYSRVHHTTDRLLYSIRS